MNSSTNTPGQVPALLVVDDEVNILRAVDRLMAGSQLRVLTFSEPAAALPFLAEPSVVVIMSDYRMPLFRGTDLLAQARKDNRFARRILISAYTDLERDSIATTTIHHFISKPYEPAALRATILQSAVDALFDTLMGRIPSLMRSMQTCATGLEVRTLLSEGLGILGVEPPPASLDPREICWNVWGQALHQADQFPERENSLIELLLNAASFTVARLSGESEAGMDPLTALLSPRVFATALGRERERAVRYKTPLSVALLEVLRGTGSSRDESSNEAAVPTVAQIIRRNIRSIDVAARIHGGRFSLLFPGLDPHGAIRVMKRIMGLIATWADSADGWEDLVSYAGIAQFSTVGTDPESFIAKAESALEFSRHHAPNGIAINDQNAIVAC